MNAQSLCEAVIIAEDHIGLRMALAAVLEDAEFLVFPAEDGQQAYEVTLSADYPCLVFLDLSMPNCDGRQFLDMVTHRDDSKPKIQIVLMSGLEDAQDFANEKNLILLKKPIDPKSIVEIAKRFCKP